MEKITSDMLQYLGIVISLFSVLSIVPKGSMVFYVTAIGAIFFSIMDIISFVKLIKSFKKN